MQITEECINYNVERLVNENAQPWEMYEQNDDTDHQRIITLGYIRGVLDMAQAMKEALTASAEDTVAKATEEFTLKDALNDLFAPARGQA